MQPPLYMQSVLDQNVITQHDSVCARAGVGVCVCVCVCVCNEFLGVNFLRAFMYENAHQWKVIVLHYGL